VKPGHRLGTARAGTATAACDPGPPRSGGARLVRSAGAGRGPRGSGGHLEV